MQVPCIFEYFLGSSLYLRAWFPSLYCAVFLNASILTQSSWFRLVEATYNKSVGWLQAPALFVQRPLTGCCLSLGCEGTPLPRRLQANVVSPLIAFLIAIWVCLWYWLLLALFVCYLFTEQFNISRAVFRSKSTHMLPVQLHPESKATNSELLN